MAFDNETNHGRVQKILDILDLIEKSATTNNSSEQELVAMLKPLLDRIGIPSTQPQSDEPEIKEPSVQMRQLTSWRDVTDMARNAPLDHVNDAMAIFLSRIDDELFNQKGKS